MMRIFPRARPREARRVRNDVEVIPDKITHEEREVCHGEAWERRRQEVWERDNGMCRDCGEQVPLHDVKDARGKVLQKSAEIHHWKKRKLGGGSRDDRMDNLVTLDWRCHNRRTARGE